MSNIKLIFTIIVIFSSFLYSFQSKEEQEIDLDKEDIKIDKKVFDSLPGHKLSTKAELEDLLDKSDLTYLHFFYMKNSSNSFMTVPFIVSVHNKLQYLAGIITTDCSEDAETKSDLPLCEDTKEPQSFPRLKALIPPKFKLNPYTKKKSSYSEVAYNQGSVSENSIYTFLTKNIANKGIKLNSENHKSMIENPDFNKVLLFTDKPQSGLIFKGLSCYFYDRILFLEVHDSETGLVNKYNIKKYPSLVIVQTLEADLETERNTNNHEVIEYTGNLKAKDIANFIEKFSLPNKLYLNNTEESKKKQSTDEFNKEKLIQTFFKKLTGEKLIENFDLKYRERRVIISIGNTEDVAEGLISFARKTNGFFSFLRVNCLDDLNSRVFCEKFKNYNKDSSENKVYLLKQTNIAWINRKKATEIISKEFEEISNKINVEFSSEIIGLTKESFQTYTFKTLNTEMKTTVIYFFDKGNIDIAVTLMSLDENLSNYVTFYAFPDHSAAEIKQFGIQGLPNLVILGRDPLNPEK